VIAHGDPRMASLGNEAKAAVTNRETRCCHVDWRRRLTTAPARKTRQAPARDSRDTKSRGGRACFQSLDQPGQADSRSQRTQKVRLNEEAGEHRAVERLGRRHVGQGTEKEGVAEQENEKHSDWARSGRLRGAKAYPATASSGPNPSSRPQRAAQHQAEGLEERAVLDERHRLCCWPSQAESPIVAAQEVAQKAAKRGLVTPRDRCRRPGRHGKIGVGQKAERTAENGQGYPGSAQLSSRNQSERRRTGAPTKRKVWWLPMPRPQAKAKVRTWRRVGPRSMRNQR